MNIQSRRQTAAGMQWSSSVYLYSAGLLLLLIALAGALAPWIIPNDPNLVDISKKFAPPSGEFPLGTDHLGRCLLSRLISAIRFSIGVSALVMAVTLTVGIAIGTAAALAGGWLDAVTMRLCDLLLAFPGLVMAFALLGILGPGLPNLVLALVITQWVYYARITRGIIVSLKERTFFSAAKVSGTRGWRMIRLHILPHLAPQLLVLAALDVGSTIVEVTSLSFLGLGIQPPTAEWGMMINEAKQYFRLHPQMILYPGVAITLVVMLCNVLGDALRDRLDPKEGEQDER